MRRIASDNAYFFYYAAAQIGGDSVERIRPSGSTQKPRVVDGVRLPPLPRETEYKIIDRASYEDALPARSHTNAVPDD